MRHGRRQVTLLVEHGHDHRHCGPTAGILVHDARTLPDGATCYSWLHTSPISAIGWQSGSVCAVTTTSNRSRNVELELQRATMSAYGYTTLDPL
jgi:hypothetical protein